MKILIVDDVDYIRKSLSKVLKDNKFDCDLAENGRIATEKLEQNSYDLVITDIMMPDIDGFEFVDFIRDHANTAISRMLILVISGGSKTVNSDLALSMLEEKADGILQKPFSKAQLLEALENAIGHDRYQRFVSSSAS